MSKKDIDFRKESRVWFGGLEDWVREKIQSWIQGLLEEEVTQLLGREKSERRRVVDRPAGYRNGYGKARRVRLSSGTITVRRPRVRNLKERFESRVLPLFAKRTRQVLDLIPEVYLHGSGPGRFRSGTQRTLRRGGGALSQYRGATQTQVAGGVESLAEPPCRRFGSGVFVGRWHLREGRLGERKGGVAGGDGRLK